MFRRGTRNATWMRRFVPFACCMSLYQLHNHVLYAGVAFALGRSSAPLVPSMPLLVGCNILFHPRAYACNIRARSFLHRRFLYHGWFAFRYHHWFLPSAFVCRRCSRWAVTLADAVRPTRDCRHLRRRTAVYGQRLPPYLPYIPRPWMAAWRAARAWTRAPYRLNYLRHISYHRRLPTWTMAFVLFLPSSRGAAGAHFGITIVPLPC